MLPPYDKAVPSETTSHGEEGCGGSWNIMQYMLGFSPFVGDHSQDSPICLGSTCGVQHPYQTKLDPYSGPETQFWAVHNSEPDSEAGSELIGSLANDLGNTGL